MYEALVATLELHKRKLPHWYLEGAIYYLTFHLHPDFEETGLFSDSEILTVKSSILHHHEKQWFCHALTVMPNHVHLIASVIPEQVKIVTVGYILASVKSYSAKMLNRGRNRTGHVWLNESFDRILRNESEYWQKMKYIFENLMRAGLASDGNTYIGFWQVDHF